MVHKKEPSEADMKSNQPTNTDIAAALDRIADLLHVQGANRFRVGAYRRAARQVRAQTRGLARWVLSEECSQLETLPDIGKRIAAIICEFVHKGKIGLLERLEGEVSPKDRFRTVPTIGPELSRRICSTLDIETLEELEMAAHSGQIEAVPGIGRRRAEAVRDSVNALLSRSGRRRSIRNRRIAEHRQEASVDPHRPAAEPTVETILEVDTEYRHKASAGHLRTIAPRRFNPEGRAWLPILHTEKNGWHFTALYSNTARAHELDRAKDWVVVYFDRRWE